MILVQEISEAVLDSLLPILNGMKADINYLKQIINQELETQLESHVTGNL